MTNTLYKSPQKAVADSSIVSWKIWGYLLILFVFRVTDSNAQVAVTVTGNTNTTPNLQTGYTSLALAITDLNTISSISGPVVLTCAASGAETAPAGGFTISFTAATTASNNVIIDGSSSVITASGALTVGALTDAIFKITGSDFVTIQNFTMQENAANTVTTAASNNMTEWGVALLHSSTTNGSQNNIIQNNTISLNRGYTNSFGIYCNNRHSTTSVTATQDVTNNTTGPNSGNKVYNNIISNVNMGIAFIGTSAAANQDVGNDIGGSSLSTGNTITNWGGAAAASGFVSNSGTSYCIFMNHQVGDRVSFNTITSAAVSGTAVTFAGIRKDYTTTAPTGTFTTNINNNTITMTSGFTSGTFNCILSQGMTSLSTATININNNQLLNCVMSGASSSSTLVGIVNASVPGVLSISNNTFRGWTSTATTGGFTGISNTGAAVTIINIDNNHIGDATGNAITFSAATSGAVNGISCSAAAAASMSISSNDFRGIVHSVTGSSLHTYIAWTHTATAGAIDNINSNTFTNLNVNTSGIIFFMSKGSTSLNGGTENCNGNSIVTAFNKGAAGGQVFLLNASTTTGSGTMNNQNNNFSNITAAGSVTVSGWNNTEGTNLTGITKNITGNTFSNWGTSGSPISGSVIVLDINKSKEGSTISNNTISGIYSTSAITALNFETNNGAINNASSITISTNTISSLISSGTGSNVTGITGGNATSNVATFNINNNIISTLSSTGAAAAVNAISVSIATTLNGSGVGGFLTNIFKNKIYDISGNQSGTTVNGINITGTTTTQAAYTYNLSNNLIEDLRATAATGLNAVNGINAAGTSNISYNAFYNTIRLDATSSSASTFGTSCIFFSSTSVIFNHRNNILVNLSVPAQNGSNSSANGIAACIRNSSGTSGTVPANYATSSNNNAYWCNPSSGTNNHLTYVEGTSSITNPKNTVADMTAFMLNRDQLSVQENPPFLSTSGSSVDFLHINTTVATAVEGGGASISGYTDDFDAPNTRNATTPDIGADEFNGIALDVTPPIITYTALSNICGNTPQTLAVTITDAGGVPTSGIGLPVLYYKINAGSYVASTGTFISGNTYSFSVGSGSVQGDVISYYVAAQDNASNVRVQPGTGAGGLTANPPAAATPPAIPDSYTNVTILSGQKTVGTGGDYPTLTAAVADYNSKCAGPNLEFILIDPAYGSESLPITINSNLGASSVNTLTIHPANSVNATVSGSSPNLSSVIKLNGAKYIIIDGSNNGSTSRNLTFTNTNATANTASVWIASTGSGAGATNNIVKNCNISTGTSAATTLGIAIQGNVNVTSAGTGADNDDNTIQNNNITIASIGIYAKGTAGTSAGGLDNLNITGNTVTNNTTVSTATLGIQVGAALNSAISQNTIDVQQNASGTVPVGISLESSFNNSSVMRNTITRVAYTGTGGVGARGITISSGSSSNVTISNNMITGVGGDNTATIINSALGICIGCSGNSLSSSTTASGINVYYNSVNMSNSYNKAANCLTAGFYVTGIPGTLNVRNNAFVNTMNNTNASGTSSKAYSIYAAAGGSGAYSAIDYNDYYVNGTQGVLGFLTSDRTTLAAIQTGFGGNANSINLDPQFTSSTNLHIQSTSSNVNAKATPIAGITTDYDNDTRNVTTPDIGADEYDPCVPAVIGACPANITQCDNHVATWTNPAATGTSPTVTCTPASGSTFTTGTTAVTCTATNACGSSNCSFTVTINESPVIGTCPSNITQCDNHIATWIDPTATGTPTPTVVCSPASGSIFATGTTTVTCTATNSCGSSSCSFTVTINESPIISACPSNIIQCDNHVATWTDPTAIGTPTPTVVCSPASGSTFATGTTTVTCTATNLCGSSSCSFIVTINESATAPTSVTTDDADNEICSSGTITLTANGGTPGIPAGTYTWYEGGCGTGSVIGTGTTLVRGPGLSVGTHVYYVRIENSCGNTTCASVTVLVTGNPPATNLPFPTVPAYACNGNNLTVSTGAVTYVTTYTWDGPAGTTFNSSGNPYSSGSISVTCNFGPPNGSGYNICVQGSNACGTTTRRCNFVRGTVNVPGVIVPANNRTVECASTSAAYSITAVTGATSYTWSITGNATVIGSGTSATVNFGAGWAGGNLCVTANTPCYSSAQRCLALSNASTAPGTISGSSTACPGSSSTYSVPVAPGAATYNWILPANTTGGSSSNSILVNFLSGFTLGDIKINIISICGITSIQKIKTVASGLPAIPASVSGSLAGLCGQTMVYSCPSVAGASSYTWTTPGTINSGQNSTSINVTFGTFSSGNVCLTANNACGQGAPRCVPVTGKPSISGNITYSPGTICANMSGIDFQINPVFGTSGYNWNFPSGVSVVLDLGNEQIVNWGSVGGTVSVTAFNACGNTTKNATVVLSCRETAPESELYDNLYSVYPNPATNRITVQFNTSEKTGYVINLIDLSGRVISTMNAAAQTGINKYEMDVSLLSTGIYLVELKSELWNKQIKLIVE